MGVERERVGYGREKEARESKKVKGREWKDQEIGWRLMRERGI